MPKLPILIAPDPRLKKPAAPVTEFDDGLRRLLDDMLETMYAAPGIGLAGPQVGVSRRVVVIDIAGREEPPAPMRLVNPEIIWKGAETRLHEEGCLSLPEQYAEVRRPAEIRFRYQDETGAEHEIHADGLLATCVQHEIDHLDGILFVDHLSPLRRGMIMKKVAKWKRENAARD